MSLDLYQILLLLATFLKGLIQEGTVMMAPFEGKLNPQMKEYGLLKCLRRFFIIIYTAESVQEEYNSLACNYNLTA